MPETFISYKNEEIGFAISEAFMEVLSNYICQTFEKKGLNNRPEWYLNLYEDFDDARRGYHSGYLVFLFEDMGEKEKEEEFISILKLAREIVSKKSPEIKVEELLKLEENKVTDTLKTKWNRPIKTKDFIEVLDIMIKMVKGEWKSTTFRMVFEGFGK